MPETVSSSPRRARRTILGAAAIVLASVVSTLAPAAAQTAPPPTTTAPTTAPSPTVDVGDGEVVVLPPGADDPSNPGGVIGGDPANPQDPSQIDPNAPVAEVPSELPVVFLPDPTPGLNAALAAIDVSRAQKVVDRANAIYQPALIGEADAFAARAAAVAARRAAGDAVRAARDVANQLAINALMYGNVADIADFVAIPQTNDLRDRALVATVSDKIFADIEAARAAYAKAITAEEAATAALRDARRVARDAEAGFLAARAEMDQAIAAAEEARRQVGPSILGVSVLDQDDLVTWYRTYYSADPPVAPIADIIASYLKVGAEEGVTGDIAFAQAMLETGGFRSGHAQDFNFAGIGAYDSCSPSCGFNFASIDAGVRSHIQLLRAYATPGLTRDQLATPPDPRLSPERVGVAGCCARWTQLTKVWATDPNYDRKVLGIYRLMVEIARARDASQA